jgi:sarcosine oxidase
VTTFDAAVVGLGTMGSFACREFARRGHSVIGLDRFAPPHERGSHTGATRVFRTAYAEHPDYVPLALRAGVLWDQLGADAGTTYLHRTGLLSVGEPESSLIAGTRASASLHHVGIHDLLQDQVRSRFPAFHIPERWHAVFEPAAGWIDVDASLRFALEQAGRAGAELRRNTRLEDWQWTGDVFELRTSTGSLRARRLVVTAGAWAGRILADLNLPLTVVRKVLVWLRPRRPELFTPDRFPVFASAGHFFYGFPDLHGAGVKLAIHWSPTSVRADPDVLQEAPHEDEIRPVLGAAADLFPDLARGLPEAFDRVLMTKTCFYTMTPDEHFIVDRHPRLGNLVFAAGFSGHGFKFAPAIGESLVDLALHAQSNLPIDFLSLKRLLR